MEALYILFHPRDKNGALTPYGGPRSRRTRALPARQQAVEFWRSRGFAEHQIPEVMALEEAAAARRRESAKREAEEYLRQRQARQQ